jgi:hypothetical protein
LGLGVLPVLQADGEDVQGGKFRKLPRKNRGQRIQVRKGILPGGSHHINHRVGIAQEGDEFALHPGRTAAGNAVHHGEDSLPGPADMQPPGRSEGGRKQDAEGDEHGPLHAAAGKQPGKEFADRRFGYRFD